MSSRLYASDTDLAIEVAMLRHEVEVLWCQVDRPAVEQANRAALAELARLLTLRGSCAPARAACLLAGGGTHRNPSAVVPSDAVSSLSPMAEATG